MTDTKPVPVPPDFYTKTMENLRNLRQEHDEDREKARAVAEEKHLRDVNEGLRERLARERVDAQRLTRERDEARAAAVATADRLAAIEHWKKTADACAVERNEARQEAHRIRAALGCVQFEPAEDAAKRILRERDVARNERGDALRTRDAARTDARFQSGRAEGVTRERDEAIKERDFARFHLESMEGSFKIAQDKIAELSKERDDLNRVLESSSHILAAQKAKTAAQNERDAIRTRYDALFAQSIHLAREVDRLKSEKADRVDAAKTPLDAWRESFPGSTVFPFAGPIDPVTFAHKIARTQRATPLKVGDRVANKELAYQAANVIAFFDAIDGVRFVAVENDWGQSHFWRLDLVAKVNP